MAEDIALPPIFAITVLMLEDSLFDRDLACARLAREGFSVTLHHAIDREDFVRFFAERTYDLILADYDVPGFTGMQALDLVRARDSQTPFIFISGVVGEEVAIDSLHRGATDYVLKQRLDRLGPALRRALNESREHRIRLQAESMARASEERFRQLTNALTQLVWTLDEHGAVTYANPAWHKVMQLEDVHWCEERVVHPEDLPACEAAWKSARERRMGFALEARMRGHSQAGYCRYSLRVVPFGAEGEPTRWLCTATDVEEQRAKEEALRTAEKLAVTGRMAATIAHEINNPLESLTNLVFLLKQDANLSPSSKQYVNLAEYELQRVSAIAKQTLSFYRDSGRPSALELHELLHDVMRLFAPRFQSRAIHSEIVVADGCTAYATGGDLRQILINLVSNALDATPYHGSVRIVAEPAPAEPSSLTRIVVEDSGEGISPEHMARLFTPFFSTKGEHGTGLGLWVSKGIVEKHGGSIAMYTRSAEDGSNRTRVEIVLARDAAARNTLDSRTTVSA